MATKVDSTQISPAVAFRAIPNQSMSGGQAAITTYTEQYDLGSNFSHTTGVFTAPVTGVYHFDLNLSLANLAAASATGYRIHGILFQNSTQVAFSYGIGLAITHDPSANLGVTLYLTAGDTVNAEGYIENGTEDLSVQGNSFSGHLVARTA